MIAILLVLYFERGVSVTHCITVSTYSVSSAVSHCSITDIDINVVMDEDDYNVMQNWMKVAEWREAKREQEEEERVMMRGIQRVRMSGISNREFFQVDRRDEIRQEEQRMKKKKENEDKKRKQDEELKRMQVEEEKRMQDAEQKRKDQEDNQESQSLFDIHEAMTKAENRRRELANLAKLYKKQ